MNTFLESKINGFSIVPTREVEDDKIYFFNEVYQNTVFCRSFISYAEAKNWCEAQLTPESKNWENSFISELTKTGVLELEEMLSL